MTNYSRRDVVRGLAVGAGALTLPRSWAAAGAEGLNAIARTRGLTFGTAMGAKGGFAMNPSANGLQRPQELEEPRYVDLVQRECGVIVATNQHKMYAIQPIPGVYHFEPGDRLVAFAEANHLAMRGHTLLWHHPRWMPRWLESHDFGAAPRAAAEKILRDYVRTTTSHYGTRIASWDVVNEAVHNVTGEMRDTALSRALGSPDETLELAFRVAREALPTTELVYNDYMGWEESNAPHRNGVLKLLERMRKRNVPIDTLGIQAHIGAGNQDSNAALGFDTRDEKAWRKFLEEVTGMGYKLVITEFDVHDTPLPADFATRDAMVAKLGEDFLDLTLSFREVHSVLCWGLVDSRSWLQGRTPRTDKLPKRPNPWGADYQPKPLRDAMARSFRRAPDRRA
jgi:endo-1,4-beta-xylanase